MEKTLEIIDVMMKRETPKQTSRAHARLIIAMLQGLCMYDDKQELEDVISTIKDIYEMD